MKVYSRLLYVFLFLLRKQYFSNLSHNKRENNCKNQVFGIFLLKITFLCGGIISPATVGGYISMLRVRGAAAVGTGV